ncbi:hypothetical protein JTY93_13620 [Pseudomonas hygromyciniae]|uniref:Uncharacterized protein n=1 Tax=Pseudomonas hygromyciniae TaxID=2812000 RepID=A0ABX7JR36_9PSED|nr:hypothetical protein [Pseudomonas hygromyciniae]MBN0978987.1 hypothetical protein [Pseudomonas hygromyciniae]QSB37438.1 hypothetical protein JTY93_13620 [Pseudomonas hygromyciniae]
MKKIYPVVSKRSVTADPIEIVLPAPEIVGLVDPVAHPGLISRAVADQDFLEVRAALWIPTPTDPAAPDVLDVHINDIGGFQSGRISSEPVFFNPPFPTHYIIRIARRFLTEGEHHISYRVVQSSLNDAGSFQAPLIIDRTAPYDSVPDGPRRLTLPAGWPGSITQPYMDANPGGILFGIPDYMAEGAQPTDRWLLYEGNSDSAEPIAEGPVFPDRQVRFTQALADLGDGLRKLVYRLVDAAGNRSEPSFELPITVSLNPAPTLGQAGVRDAISLIGVGDRLIDRADTAASSGMFVIIPSYVDADRTADAFLVRLTTANGVREIGPYPLGGSPFPYNFHIDFPTLVALYGTSTGAINLRVEYAVRRHGVLHWVPAPTDIELELEVGGPINPWEPDLVNPNLPLPVLTGRGSGLTNELNELDAEKDADVVVRLWSAMPLPSAHPFYIDLFYMNDLVDSAFVDNVGAMPGDEIPMVLAWPYIRRHSNNLIPLRYDIRLASTHNRVSSPNQTINVTANVISLRAPEVVDASSAVPGVVPGQIGCKAVPAPNRILQVFVPPSEHFEPGMIVNVDWVGCSDDDGAVPIPGATGTFPFGPLNFQQTQVGFNVPVGPYDTYVKPINQASFSMGSAKISYRISIIGIPTPVESAEAIYWVRGVIPGPAYCDGSPWP